MTDHVEAVLAQWRRERPDLDVSPMAVIGRISRVAKQADDHLARNFADHGLDRASFDVLATLRRSGEPFTLAPKDLAGSTMVTSSAVAQRLNKLEADGLVVREPSEADGRGKKVHLTDVGRRLVDAALPHHLATEEELLAPLTKRERRQLADLLAKLDQHR
ncbi:MarR family winged helix-turn-helix transcriptional regulator [Pseudarthrobacter sp. NamE5]|uniref:MarR family winged helix-turn-helix transcriptional regulator n=1 Tax=Pseudarthrobacter sp. NamE5 TaxID=2576839 RepID=UPI00110C1967|nr:MarR family transcriptional regulator [Pseudarthrobacter sp. NamE5]TLM80919.1 MarR family transcriptional regulator [Pseudarthrobacter sp. NamE5]